MKRDRVVSNSSEVNAAEAGKKQKVAEDRNEEASFGQAIRSAYDLALAIRMATGDYYLTEKLKYDPEVQVLGKLVADFKVQSESDPKKAQVLSQLTAIHKEVAKTLHSYRTGLYDSRFKLKVTQPGCEREIYVSEYSDFEDELPKWLENAPISGYGDNRTLETKVDPTVRKAREIPSSGFQVSDKLLTDIATLWAENFLPPKVRVEPYKIHLYGEGGHFQSHKDTPETDLVGTFLLGIGDSAADSPRSGNFCIGDLRLSARPGQWVAFHPDVPHSVSPLTKGCRAVIAFKVFSLDSDITWGSQAKEERLPKLAEEATSVLQQIPRPFGMILEHQYPMGTREASLTGIDAIILAAAKKLPDSLIEIIPVVVRLIEEDIDEYPENEYDDEHVRSWVIPFTRHHVDLFLDRDVEAAKEAVSWLDDVKWMPFYAVDFKENGMEMTRKREELNWRGNESDGMRESSIYLTYAMLVLPRKE